MAELSIPNVTCVESIGNYGRFSAEPLERGFGTTLGNAMRRVLLGSLAGAAVTWVKIDGVEHEFTTIPNAKEDVMDFLLNVKELRLRSITRQPGRLVLDVQGEGIFSAGDITRTIDFEVVNPELGLVTLNSGDAKLYVEFNVELGRGYVPAGSADGVAPVGALPVDATFTPVRKANFSVGSIRPGEERSAERLILEIWTDGTLAPSDAVSQSAEILIEQFTSFRELELPAEQGAGGTAIPPEKYNIPLSDLGLSTRAHNSLRRGDITTLGQLVDRTREGMPPLPGFGSKSQKEVEDILAQWGYAPSPKGRAKRK
ncbi:MAG: DNA-directed RNA polymerase subunit alpha [Chloroflexota bacterium]